MWPSGLLISFKIHPERLIISQYLVKLMTILTQTTMGKMSGKVTAQFLGNKVAILGITASGIFHTNKSTSLLQMKQ